MMGRFRVVAVIATVGMALGGYANQTSIEPRNAAAAPVHRSTKSMSTPDPHGVWRAGPQSGMDVLLPRSSSPLFSP